MIWFLRLLFSFILITMLCVTGWASNQGAIWNIPHSVTSHPWFIATLFDTYFAFLVFYCWVAYKEVSIVARVVWFILIMVLGNIAIASYMLIQLFRLPADANLDRLVMRQP